MRLRVTGPPLGAAVLLCAAAGAAGCGRSRDLDRAIDGGVRRAVTSPAHAPTAVRWTDVRRAAPGNDSTVLLPVGMCFAGADLLVADAGSQRVYRFTPEGRLAAGFGRNGEGPGEYRRISSVQCSPDGRTVLVADPGLARVTFLAPDGSYRGAVQGPPMPQGIPYYGSFALANDGSWFHSWLGSKVGPFLADAEWRAVRAVEARSPTGTPLRRFGVPFPFSGTVFRRVFNHTDLAWRADTLWVLYQAPATIVAYDRAGNAVDTLRLPVYHRGRDPVLEVGRGRLPGGYRKSRAHYYPNVGGLSAFGDAHLLTIRFRAYREVTQYSPSGSSLEFWADSYVDVIGRDGRVACSIPFPGKGRAVAGNGRAIAVLTEDLKSGDVTVLLARAPRCGGEAPGRLAAGGPA